MFLLVSTVSQRLEGMGQLTIKPRRLLKGHQAKVLCADWSSDKRHIVSSSQVFKINSMYILRDFHSSSQRMARLLFGMLSPQIKSMLLPCPLLGNANYSLQTMLFINLLLLFSRVMACAFAPSGNLVACGYATFLY